MLVGYILLSTEGLRGGGMGDLMRVVMREERKMRINVHFFQIEKIKVRYSVEEAAAHQLPCTVPAAGQSLSAGTPSAHSQPAVK